MPLLTATQRKCNLGVLWGPPIVGASCYGSAANEAMLLSRDALPQGMPSA